MAISEAEAILRIVVAAGLTGLLGAERELRGKEAGLRTFTLVGIGAALFTCVGALLAATTNDSATRIAAQVVSGIGFIGAGVIFRQGSHTKNLTTAAGIWTSAAVGVACGARFFLLAGVTTGIVLIALTIYRFIEGRIGPPSERPSEEAAVQ